MNNNADNQNSIPEGESISDYYAGSTVSGFSGAFEDDSARPVMGTDGQAAQPYAPPVMYEIAQPYDQMVYGQPVQPYVPPMVGQPVQPYAPPMVGQPVQQYAPPMVGQPVQPYVPPMYGQPVQQYAPPMVGQPVQPYAPPLVGQPVQQYVPPMYGQPVQQYAPPMYGQPVQQYPVIPKKVLDRKLFRKHCSRVGLMLMADVGLMMGVEILVIIIAVIVLVVMGMINSSDMSDTAALTALLLSPIMFAGGLSAIVGNMLPSSLHLRKWRIKFADPFKGDKLNPLFTLTALFTALGLNSAWCYVYYYILKPWFGGVMGYFPENSDQLYTPYNMPLVGMICYLMWVCVIAPVTEEYMFRGAMLRTLSNYGSGFAIVASALAFGLMHGNMGQTPMAFLIGLVMGYVAAKSGNIRQTIFIHMVNNVIASIPQILSYFLPGWYDTYAAYVEYFDYATMAFAALVLLYFIIRRSTGLSSRKKRLASGSDKLSGAERAWIRLEVPDERRLPQLDSVKHKFCHFVTSGGMIFFIIYCLLNVFIVSIMPYLLKQSIPGMGF